MVYTAVCHSVITVLLTDGSAETDWFVKRKETLHFVVFSLSAVPFKNGKWTVIFNVQPTDSCVLCVRVISSLSAKWD